jgi:hypothetical protein
MYTMSDDRSHFVDPLAVATAEGELPTRVHPTGFTLNTLLAASVLLGATETIGLARRRLRSRKGLCPACGYDRRGLQVEAACPECGGKAS